VIFAEGTIDAFEEFLSCPIVCLDPTDDPFNPTLPFVDAICTIGDGTPEYETYLVDLAATCKSLDGRIVYVDYNYGDDCDGPVSKIVMVPECFSNMCKKEKSLAYINEYYENDFYCELDANLSKRKLPKAPKDCKKLKVPKANKAVKAAKAMAKKAKRYSNSKK
jgi:hypothetical protein